MPNIHPMLVHFPIALIIVVVILDLLGLFLKRKRLIDSSTILTVFTLAGAVLAVISGLLAEDSVWQSAAAHELLEKHELMGFIALGVIAIFALVRMALRNSLKGGLIWLVLALGIAGGGVTVYGAYLGGELVYTHGTGVKAVEKATQSNAILEGKLKAVKRSDKQAIENLEQSD